MSKTRRAREFLQQYRTAYDKYVQILEKVERIKNASPKSPALTGMPHGGGISDLSDKMAEAEVTLEAYRAQLEALGARMGEVRAAIDRMCGKDATVLSFKYIDFLTLSQIALIMDEPLDAIYKRHQRALERLEW